MYFGSSIPDMKNALIPPRVAGLSLAAVFLLGMLSAHAQASQPSPSDLIKPLDARADTTKLRYESTFAQDRRLAPDPVGDWQANNQTVLQIGGWRAYARQAQQPDPADGPAANPPAQTGGAHHTEQRQQPDQPQARPAMQEHSHGQHPPQPCRQPQQPQQTQQLQQSQQSSQGK